jgi:hypothetical protein
MATLKDVMAAVEALARKQLLVGIPREKSDRGDGAFPNAARGYVFELGSPAINMPARPHLVPGVEAVKDQITNLLQGAANAALDGNIDAIDVALGQAGTVAVNSVQRIIRSKIPPPIRPESYLARTTGRARRRQRARREGTPLIEVARQEAPGATPLIDTAAYSRSITYVIREK